MAPVDIERHFRPVFDQAKELRDSYYRNEERAERKDSLTDGYDTISASGIQKVSDKKNVLSSMVSSMFHPQVSRSPPAEKKSLCIECHL